MGGAVNGRGCEWAGLSVGGAVNGPAVSGWGTEWGGDCEWAGYEWLEL